MGLLMETYGTSHRVYIMSTFFYAKLSRNGYRGVKRWLKKVNMNTLRLLLVPIHLGVHWAIAAIDFKLKVSDAEVVCVVHFVIFIECVYTYVEDPLF